jgi:hypothetical protein
MIAMLPSSNTVSALKTAEIESIENTIRKERDSE